MSFVALFLDSVDVEIRICAPVRVCVNCKVSSRYYDFGAFADLDPFSIAGMS